MGEPRALATTQAGTEPVLGLLGRLVAFLERRRNSLMPPLLRTACAALALLAAAGIGGCSDSDSGMHMTSAANAASMSPPAGYQKVSELVKLPDFLPGLGTLYVQPSTLPAGPFLAYDRNG